MPRQGSQRGGQAGRVHHPCIPDRGELRALPPLPQGWAVLLPAAHSRTGPCVEMSQWMVSFLLLQQAPQSKQYRRSAPSQASNPSERSNTNISLADDTGQVGDAADEVTGEGGAEVRGQVLDGAAQQCEENETGRPGTVVRGRLRKTLKQHGTLTDSVCGGIQRQELRQAIAGKPLARCLHQQSARRRPCH